MDEDVDALCRTLEAHGLSPDRARQLADSQSADIEQSGARLHHVVPVATGWLVVSTVALTDAEVFADREDAVQRARELANGDAETVVLHDAEGHSSRAGRDPGS